MVHFCVKVENALGPSNRADYAEPVRTLAVDAGYKPEAELKGSTSNSFTLGWTGPSEETRHLIGYFVATYGDAAMRQQEKVFNFIIIIGYYVTRNA